MSARHDANEPNHAATRTGTPATAPQTRAPPGRAIRSDHPLQALQRAAGNRAVSAYVQRLASSRPPAAVGGAGSSAAPARAGPGGPPAPVVTGPVAAAAPAGPAHAGVPTTGTPSPAQDPTDGGGPDHAATAAGTGGPAQPLGQLEAVDSADYAAHLARAAPASATALEAEHAAMATHLPARPTPTGLPVGEPPPLREPPQPAAPPPLPTPGPDADASQADDLARQGAAAVSETAAGAQVEVPPTTAMIQPDETPAPLPSLAVAPAPAAVRPPVPVATAGLERAALNASMNAEVHDMTSRALAPALAAGAGHEAAVATVRSGAEQSLADATAATTTQQRTAAAVADAEVRDLHAGWEQEKVRLIGSYQAQIQSEAGQVHAEATRTMDDARAQSETEEQNGAAAQRDAEPGLGDRIQAAGSSAVGAVGELAAGALDLVGGIFEAAKRRIVSLVVHLGQVIRERVDAAVLALRDGVRRVGTAISGAIRRGRDLVVRLAGALAAAANRIWQAARQRLTQLWDRLTAAVGRALAAAAGIARRIADALGKVGQIVGLLGNKLLGFLAEVVTDPEEKVGRPIVALAAPLAAAVPGKAQELGQEKAAGVPDAAGTTVALQRQVEPGPPGESFAAGVVRHATAAGAEFLQHWVVNLLKIVASILVFPVAACLQLPGLWRELVGIFVPAPGGGDRLDHLLGVFRQVVNIAGLVIGGVGVWAFLIALAFPPAEPFLGGGYLALSLAVLAADLVVGAAQMTKAFVGASRATEPEARELYLSMFSGSLIAASITVMMVLLGALAAWLAQSFRSLKAGPAGAVAGAGKPAVGKGEAIGEPARTDVGAKGGPVPRPNEWPYSNPPNMVTVPPGTPLELSSLNPRLKYLWVVDADGNFKYAPEGQNTSDFVKPLPPDEGFKIKHGDLQPDPSGMARGPARAGGELTNVPGPDGAPSDVWRIDNDSSYTFRRVNENGEPLPWLPADSIKAVWQHLVDGGTPGGKLVTTDVLAAERVKRGVP